MVMYWCHQAIHIPPKRKAGRRDEANKPAMKMRRCILASILLMLSLEATFLVAADDVGTILLPSKGKDQVVMEAPRPWRCCDVTSCTRSIPPTCACEDVVDNCAATCKVCRPVSPPRRVCLDQYTGDTGPKCTEEAN